MKALHKIDFPVQMLILIGSFASMLIQPNYVVLGYLFGIGGWQVLMAILFAFDAPEYRDSGRIMYERILLAVAVIGMILAFFPPALMIYGVIMIFVGFVMGIWNMSITYSEFQLAKSEHDVWDII